MNDNNNEIRKENLQKQVASDSAPLRMLRGDLDDISEDELRILRFVENDLEFELRMKAEAHYQMDCYQTSKKYLETYVRYFQKSAMVWNRLGTLHSALDDEIRAAYCYAEAFRLEPEDFDYFFNYASSLHELSRMHDAKKVICDYFVKHPLERKKVFFYWNDNELDMVFITSCWRDRNKNSTEDLNEIPIKIAKPIDEGLLP